MATQIVHASFLQPYKGLNYCGDKFYLYESDDNEIYLYLIDMAGHGYEAYRRGDDVLAIIEQKLNKYIPVNDQLEQLHDLISSDMLCVAAIARINLDNSTVEYASVGTLVARYVSSDGSYHNLPQDDGVLGYIKSDVHPHKITLSKGDLFLVYSDGVQSNFDMGEYKSILTDDVEDVAENIVVDFGKDDDDSSCIAIKVI